MIDLLASGIAGVWDQRTKTIPNIITIPLILYGIYTGIDLTVFIITLMLCIFMDHYEIWHEGDVKLIIGLSLVAPERFFYIIIGTWASTIPITFYTAFKSLPDYRYAYAPYIFLGVIFSYFF